MQLTLPDLYAVDPELAAGLQALLTFQEGTGSIEDVFGVTFTASANPLVSSDGEVGGSGGGGSVGVSGGAQGVSSEGEVSSNLQVRRSVHRIRMSSLTFSLLLARLYLTVCLCIFCILYSVFCVLCVGGWIHRTG